MFRELIARKNGQTTVLKFVLWYYAQVHPHKTDAMENIY